MRKNKILKNILNIKYISFVVLSAMVLLLLSYILNKYNLAYYNIMFAIIFGFYCIKSLYLLFIEENYD